MYKPRLWNALQLQDIVVDSKQAESAATKIEIDKEEQKVLPKEDVSKVAEE